MVWRQICKEKSTGFWAQRRMNTFPPRGLLGTWVLRKKRQVFWIPREEWNTFKYLFNIRKETILPLPVLSEATVPGDGAVINKKCIHSSCSPGFIV